MYDEGPIHPANVHLPPIRQRAAQPQSQDDEAKVSIGCDAYERSGLKSVCTLYCYDA